MDHAIIVKYCIVVNKLCLNNIGAVLRLKLHVDYVNTRVMSTSVVSTSIVMNNCAVVVLLTLTYHYILPLSLTQ